MSDEVYSNVRAAGRSRSDFEPLNIAEAHVVSAARHGTLANFRENQSAVAPANGPSIRSSIIRFLALGGDKDNPVHEKGIHIAGARIRGDIDLEACNVKVPLTFEDCYLDGTLLLRDSEAQGLFLKGPM